MANTYTIQSHTNPTLTYTVTFPDSGQPYCTCRGYGYRRTCSHIKEAMHNLEEQLSLAAIQADTMVYFCRACQTELTMPHTFTGLCLTCTTKETFNSRA